MIWAIAMRLVPIVPQFMSHQVGHAGYPIQMLRKPKSKKSAADSAIESDPNGVAIKVSASEKMTHVTIESPASCVVEGSQFIQQV